MVLYHLLRLLKFIGIVLLAGGTLGSFLASTSADRKRAVHSVASPGLLLTWLAGYLLSLNLGVSLGELWTLGGLVLSTAAHVALIRSASQARTPVNVASVAVPLFLVLVLMVFRPTWASVLP